MNNAMLYVFLRFHHKQKCWRKSGKKGFTSHPLEMEPNITVMYRVQ